MNKEGDETFLMQPTYVNKRMENINYKLMQIKNIIYRQPSVSYETQNEWIRATTPHDILSLFLKLRMVLYHEYLAL